MSSLQDPFDLIKTGQEMDNIVPFLAPNKINQMIDAAVAHPQFAAQKPAKLKSWKYGGLAIAASLALFMVFLGPTQTFVMDGENPSLSQAPSSTEDVGEFSELVMLENMERF
ncbi:MAG: hypothetical protein A3B66_05080 [Alphaproteobacteria bacterium RIFCSPHIGHO2_02_FULL_46_13]|nr:MAG: hypothetical protein A3B66_05080 [Alphaproteobacteria bacterium RIFCSPHIGHO2_02_FULL_46_13]